MSKDGEYAPKRNKASEQEDDALNEEPVNDDETLPENDVGKKGPTDEIANEMANLQNPQIQRDSIVPEEPRKLSEREQLVAEANMTKKNQNADAMNSHLGGVSAVKSMINRKKIKEIRKKIEVTRKQKDEKNEKLKTILRKKKIEQRELRSKLMAQIVRVFPELISGVGIPVAVWEIIKLSHKNKEMKRLKADLKKIVIHMANNEQEFKKNEERMETEVYNLINVYQREAPAANEPMAQQKAA
jgi:hypothetical protein